MSIVNRPEVSRPIVWLYSGIAVFIAVMTVIIVYVSLPAVRTGVIIGVVVLLAVEAVMLSILTSIYRTRYVLNNGELVLRASPFIGGNKRIPLKTIKSVDKTLIPFGIRLLGASFYGGYYYFPNVGRTFVVITNFRDGVLISAEHTNCLITPRNPENFIDTIRKKLA